MEKKTYAVKLVYENGEIEFKEYDTFEKAMEMHEWYMESSLYEICYTELIW